MKLLTAVLILAVAPASFSQARQGQRQPTIPISTQTLLDGVKSPESRGVIKAVVRLECPADRIKGTGFAIRSGTVVVTNSHVLGSCSASALKGRASSRDGDIEFTKIINDPDRDLALLLVRDPLPFALTLAGDQHPSVETEVETWGYPLRYDDSAPILSRGYVAGYRQFVATDVNGKSKAPVSRVIVNGALNPGNSGGPLIDRSNGNVIGVVVEKWILNLPDVEKVIEALPKGGVALSGNLTATLSDGTTRALSEEQEVALALEELYRGIQVVVGEAIAVSELNALITAHQAELPATRR